MNNQSEALRLAHLLELDKWPDAAAELRRQQARIAELEAARFAYASEFKPDANGDPDVGNIHANIRALKAQLATCTALLKKTPKIMQNIYVGKDSQSWGAQAKAVLDAAIAAQAKQKGKA